MLFLNGVKQLINKMNIIKTDYCRPYEYHEIISPKKRYIFDMQCWLPPTPEGEFYLNNPLLCYLHATWSCN